MGIIWVLERPGRGEAALAALLHGDFAVRAFASVKSFMRLSRMSRLKPDVILVNASDFAGEIENLDSIIRLNWDSSQLLYVSDGAASGLSAESLLFPLEQIKELPFFVQRLVSRDKDLTTASYWEAGDISLDADESRLRILPDGEWIKLAPKEAQLLRHMIRFQDRFLSHEDLSAEVWKEVKVSPKSIASHVSRLRRHLENSQVAIESIYGGGYRLVCSRD